MGTMAESVLRFYAEQMAQDPNACDPYAYQSRCGKAADHVSYSNAVYLYISMNTNKFNVGRPRSIWLHMQLFMLFRHILRKGI